MAAMEDPRKENGRRIWGRAVAVLCSGASHTCWWDSLRLATGLLKVPFSTDPGYACLEPAQQTLDCDQPVQEQEEERKRQKQVRLVLERKLRGDIAGVQVACSGHDLVVVLLVEEFV